MANKLQYNYEDLFIHKNQFEKTASNGKYYKIPFSNISKSNITSNMFQGNYIATTIYIVRKIHTIPKMNFDGELLIQHKSQSNDEKPLFISIPLKTQKAIVSKIDLLTQPNKDVELNLNEDIYSNSASYYENDKQRVIILHNVLNVGIQFENLSTGNVVTPKSTFTDVSIEPILGKEGFIEGNETYVENAAYCVPIDENDHTIQNDASTIIPAGSETNQHKTLVSQLTTATNFAIFFTLAIFVVWTIPTIYHIFIVLLIMNNYGLSRQQLFNRISGADIMTSFIFIGISFSLIVNGVGTKDPTVSVVGFYFLIFYMLIFARLQYDRLLNDGTSFVNYITELHQTLQEKIREFIKESNKLKNLNPKINEDSLPYLKEEEVKMDEITPDIGGFLMENTMNLFYDKGAQEGDDGQNNSVETWDWIRFILFLVCFGGPFVTLLLFDTLQQGLFITYLPVYFIFISLYILAFYEYSYNKSSEEKFEHYIFYEYLKKRTQKQAPAAAPATAP